MLRRIPSLGCLTQPLLSHSHGLTCLLVSRLTSRFCFSVQLLFCRISHGRPNLFLPDLSLSTGSITVDQICLTICQICLTVCQICHRRPDLSHRLPDLSHRLPDLSQLPTAGVPVVCLSHGFLSLAGAVRKFSICFSQ